MFRRIDYCVQDVPHGGNVHVSCQLDQYLAGRASSAAPTHSEPGPALRQGASLPVSFCIQNSGFWTPPLRPARRAPDNPAALL
jgi:hypothetical protein